MVCPKCNSAIIEGAAFCSACGEKVAVESTQGVKHCLVCGNVIQEENKFCGKCGTVVGTVNKPVVKTISELKQNSSGKIGSSYFVSVVSAIISLVIRITTQQTYYSWSNLLDNRKVVGIDSDMKPFLTVIPIVAAIVVSLLVVSDKNSSAQKKTTAFIINLIFIALAVLLIWFDIPYSIIDF